MVGRARRIKPEDLRAPTQEPGTMWPGCDERFDHLVKEALIQLLCGHETTVRAIFAVRLLLVDGLLSQPLDPIHRPSGS